MLEHFLSETSEIIYDLSSFKTFFSTAFVHFACNETLT